MITRDEIIQAMQVSDGEGGFVIFTKEEAEFLSKATMAFNKAFHDQDVKPLKLLDPYRDRNLNDFPPDFISWLENLMRIGKRSEKVIDIKAPKKRGIGYTKNAPMVTEFLKSHPELLEKVKKVPPLHLLAALATRAEKEQLKKEIEDLKNGDKDNDT